MAHKSTNRTLIYYVDFFVSPHTPFEILEGKVVHPYAIPHRDVFCLFSVWSSFIIYMINFEPKRYDIKECAMCGVY